MNINVTNSIKSFLSLDKFSKTVSEMPKLFTPMTDLIFPPAVREQKTSPYIAISDIKDETGAVPVTKRGSQSYPVGKDAQDISVIEVHPIAISKFILGRELNDLIHIGETSSIEAKLTEAVKELRDRTAKTVEILCCQALSGEISYPANTGSFGSVPYSVKIGKLKTATDSTLTATSSLGDLQKALESHFVAQVQTSASADIRFLAGSDVYSTILTIVTTAQSNVPVQWTDYGMVLFGKYKIMLVPNTYTVPGKTDVNNVIDPKKMQTVDLKNTGKLFYAALDELDSKLQPLQFFVNYEESKDPSGIKIFSSSKPFPAFAVSKSVIKKYIA